MCGPCAGAFSLTPSSLASSPPTCTSRCLSLEMPGTPARATSGTVQRPFKAGTANPALQPKVHTAVAPIGPGRKRLAFIQQGVLALHLGHLLAREDKHVEQKHALGMLHSVEAIGAVQARVKSSCAGADRAGVHAGVPLAGLGSAIEAHRAVFSIEATPADGGADMAHLSGHTYVRRVERVVSGPGQPSRGQCGGGGQQSKRGAHGQHPKSPKETAKLRA